MLHRWLADFVVVLHAGFVLFVVLGGLLALRWPWVAWLHLPAAVWGVVVEVTGWVCPLTPLENQLRRLGGEAGYRGGFIERYVWSLLYPEGLTRQTQLWIGLGVLVLNVAVYAWLWRRRARSRDPRAGPRHGPTAAERRG